MPVRPRSRFWPPIAPVPGTPWVADHGISPGLAPARPAARERDRNELVAVRAAFILADEPAVKAYTLHFEAQMRRGKVRRLLYAGYMHFARTAVILSGLDAREIQ